MIHDVPEPLRLAGVCYESMADGEGVRAAFYFQGCMHHCPGCHNPTTHDFSSGELITPEMIETFAREINQRPYLSGITLTGGDPLYHPEAIERFLTTLLPKLTHRKTVWLYTGFLWEEVFDLPLMRMVDVVVDGPFEQSYADKRLAYRGSANQRLIDAHRSLASDDAWEAILYVPAC